jgi:diguanylate cyclase (GGDEF)-like protein
MAATYNEDIVLAKWRKSSALVAALGAAAIGFFLLLTYMTARAQQEQQLSRELLQRLAVTDSLTQLANRRHAVDSANLEIKKAQRQGLALSFVLMDLDHFKEINDSHGHEKGDLVLQQVASVLKQLCRQTDVVSRFGGEEFLVILSGTDLHGAEISSEKIRKALDEDVHDDFAGIPRVTASFGVAQWHPSEADFKDTLRRADRALYQAKRKGRNCVQLDRTFS